MGTAFNFDKQGVQRIVKTVRNAERTAGAGSPPPTHPVNRATSWYAQIVGESKTKLGYYSWTTVDPSTVSPGIFWQNHPGVSYYPGLFVERTPRVFDSGCSACDINHASGVAPGTIVRMSFGGYAPNASPTDPAPAPAAAGAGDVDVKVSSGTSYPVYLFEVAAAPYAVLLGKNAIPAGKGMGGGNAVNSSSGSTNLAGGVYRGAIVYPSIGTNGGIYGSTNATSIALDPFNGGNNLAMFGSLDAIPFGSLYREFGQQVYIVNYPEFGGTAQTHVLTDVLYAGGGGGTWPAVRNGVANDGIPVWCIQGPRVATFGAKLSYNASGGSPGGGNAYDILPLTAPGGAPTVGTAIYGNPNPVVGSLVPHGTAAITNYATQGVVMWSTGNTPDQPYLIVWANETMTVPVP